MQLITGFDREIAHWVGKRTNVENFGPCRAIGIATQDKIIAGIVYSNYRDGSIEATIAADDPRWCRRGVLRTIFTYPFSQLNCRRVTCIIPPGNTRSLKLCQGLGFAIEGQCAEAFANGDDGVILGMLKRNCKWI